MNSSLTGALAPEQTPPFKSPETAVSAQQKMVLLEYWRTVTKRKWPIAGIVLVAIILATIVAQSLTPIYKSSATLLIELGRSRIVSIEDVVGSSPIQGREMLLTQIEVIKSRDVIEGAVRRERLWEHPAYDPRKVPPSWLQRLSQLWGFSKPNATWSEEKLVAGAVELARTELLIEGVGLSQLVKVSYESPDAGLSARMANRVAESYIANQREVRLNAARDANATLLDNLGQLKEKLTEAERKLQRYREARGLVNLSGSPLTLAGQKATAVTESLSKARTRRLELEGAYSQVKAISNGDYTGVPWVMRDPAAQEAQRQVATARRRLLELSQTLGPRNNKVIEAQEQVDEAELLSRRQSAAAADSLRSEYELAQATERALAGDLASARSSVGDLNRDEFALAALERDVITSRQLYDMFVTRGKETSLSGEVQGAAARVVEQAILVATPIRPFKPRIIGLAAIAAALIGAAVALLLDALDNTIKGVNDAEMRLRLPLLVALPLLKDKNLDKETPIFLSSPESHYAEAIRTARTGVVLSTLDAVQKTLLVTSTVPGEGKTTLAINLALAHAQTRRTLLIDADMRRPQVARRTGAELGGKGLSNLVSGDATVDECLQPAGGGSTLMLLTVGDLPPNPLELLLSQRFEQVLTQLRQMFDIVVIDSPPIGLVSDALLLAPKVTGTILVVKAMSTPASYASKTIASLQRSGGNILGVVLNALDFTESEKYYGEHNSSGGRYDEAYGYVGYGYGYGYGSKPEAAAPPQQTKVLGV